MRPGGRKILIQIVLGGELEILSKTRPRIPGEPRILFSACPRRAEDTFPGLVR
jgi:hypothetical protein